MKSWRAVAILTLTLFLRGSARPQSLLQKADKVAEKRNNPSGQDEGAAMAGGKLFHRECAGCHGEGGMGNGRGHTPTLASSLVRQANPGTLFWILRNGSATHRMPSFAQLPEQERWQIIRYLQRGTHDAVR